MYWQRHKTLEERFWEKVLVGEKGECWAWIGYKGSFGRGVMWNGRTNENAPRISYRLMRGDIPHGLGVLHKCDNPNCVNPKHLFLGDQKDNVRDAIQKNRFKQNKARSGERHHFAKLSGMDVKEIKRLYKTMDIPASKLGRLYDVSKSQIYRIVNGQRWAEAT